MKLPIYLYGHPVLRKISEPIEAADDELRTLVSNMFETMYNSDGVGLAAPQVGINRRLVVIDGSVLAEEFPECADTRMCLINPEIEILDGEPVSHAEGCLSLPGIAEDVRRVEHLRLRWRDENFEPHEKEFSGFIARIIQHECDHLEGRMFIDHISPTRRFLNKRKLTNIVEGKTRVDYPAKYAPVGRRK
ncbi:MAG: peptide deformylase [Bacteroidales bacterium]|nr:peptide deformylase [Bacteroidales bacterium]MDY2916790.1 peptide deformylase [Muribaculaceae bacterium]